ncbi:glyoxylate/hydroxypyruvate reductase A [Pseudosulfitobacter sp. DSM 107133]|uniref:2-hydroxyacid dehydrogenase n=1 Tax=Pseudosulfitobacter sp. DSM 107133 TaxID=2883100 RepID=UPI000DF47E1A|nr:glyoxylate/hydroxypyruvate reductase A [Pseudosulfitobacter sp. DSM 107133]UOA25736.1 Glyoxylate/hydroxypyruvate reductase A [Pseudosulfitobacter sp. DSM 107133]
MINVLFAAQPDGWDSYETPLKQAIANAGVTAFLARDIPPEDVDYIVYAPSSPLQDFTPYTRAKAVLNLWAGVEKIVGNPTLNIPLTRMVDSGLSQGMCEWVTGHTLRHHLGMDAHINCAPGHWVNVAPPLAWDRKVTVLGLGELGTACAQMLSQIGFDVTGWSRSAKDIDGIRCLSGDAGLTQALTGAEIVVLLLPDTPATENTLNADTLALLAQGACIINPGRGPLIDDDALLAALDSGQIGHATLDVFRIEPLPEAHPYWHHPRVTVTPHVAAETRAKYSALTVAENIRRGEAGEPLLHLVDRTAGY